MIYERIVKLLYNCFDGQTLTYIKNGKEVKNVEENKGDNQIIIDTYYNDVYKGKEAELGHYFRHLYHILKYTHESNIVTKKKYIDIVQAQMSDDELYLVFYNGISKFGKEKLQPFLEEYGFLENIRSRGKIFDLHASQFYPKTKFKYLTSQ